MDRVATEPESSGRGSTHQASTPLGLTPQSAATSTINSSPSPQIDKANTNSFYSTRSEGQIEGTTTFVPALSVITEFSTEQTYGSGIDELSENKAQSAYLPFDGTDSLPQLPPGVRRPSQFQYSEQVQSTTTSSRPVSQNKNTFTRDSYSTVPAEFTAPQGGHQLPSRYSPESSRIPAAQTPWQTYSSRTGDIPALSPLMPYESQHSNLSPPSSPGSASRYPPQSSSVPNVPAPQTSQPFRERTHQQGASPRSYVSVAPGDGPPGMPQGWWGRRLATTPSPYIQPTYTSRYDSRMTNSKTSTSRQAGYVASDPFRVSRGNDKVGAPSDGLTFDDIPMPPESAPSPVPSRYYTPLSNPPTVTPTPHTPYYVSPLNNPPAFTTHTSRPFYGHSSNNLSQGQSIHGELRHGKTPQSVPSQFYYSPAHAPAPQVNRPSSQHFFPQPVPLRSSSTENVSTPWHTPYYGPSSNPPQAPSIDAEPPQGFIPPRIYSPQAENAPAPWQASNAQPQHVFPHSVPPRSSSMENAFTPQTSWQLDPAGTPQSPQFMSGPSGSANTVPLPEAHGLSHSWTQSQVPVSPVPSSQQSSIKVNAPYAASPFIPPLPSSRPSSPSRPQDTSFTSLAYEPQRANQSSFRPYIFDSPYPSFHYPQYYQPDPPKNSKFFSRVTGFFRRSQRTHSPANPQPFTAIYPQPFTQPYTEIYPSMVSETNWQEVAFKFLADTLPRQVYLHFLLRLPSLYFSRVARIFEEADMSLPELKKMAFTAASQGLTHEYEIQKAFESVRGAPAYQRLTSTWESFIDSVMREWKILNIISVLLLSAILTILQIQDAAEDPLTRYTALFSLICSLISLLFGCMYIIRFGTMRRTYKAAEWALEAKKTKLLIWWNVWIMLAMPAIWLTWSIILYILCIMSFVWRSGASITPPSELSERGLLAIRISITVVLGFGVLYGFLIMTTFQRYGTAMDKRWKKRIDKWIEEKSAGNTEMYPQPTLDHRPYSSPWFYPDRPTMHPPHTDNHPRYHHPPYDRYPYVPGTATDSLTKLNTLMNNSSNLQDRHSAAYIPNPRGSHDRPLFPDKEEIATTSEEVPSRLIPKTTPEPLAPSIPESPTTFSPDLSDGANDNALGVSPGLGNRDNDDGDVPGDRNRVRFQLPSSGPRNP